MADSQQHWYCDVCGEKIQKADDGYVVWKDDEHLKSHSFKVIHQGKCDKDRNFSLSAALGDFLGADGLAYCLSFLSLGALKHAHGEKYVRVGDLDNFVDFVRRMQTPNYEEARRLFYEQSVIEDNADSNEVGPYMQKNLLNLLAKHKA